MECSSPFQKLVNRNDDLRQLLEKGYAIAIDAGFLIVRDIPYLDSEKALKSGAIVAKLEFVDQERVKQTDHQVFFAGSAPCGLDGKPIANLGGGTVNVPLGEASKDVIVQRSFSNKPKATGQFKDFFDKIESYVAIIAGPAMELHPEATPLTFRAVQEVASDSVFNFHDTLSSRAEIGDLSAKLKDDVVAVVGLGGSGAYLLDFLVKTHVREIRGFDLDRFHVHNAFRSPGALSEAELGKTKTEVYDARYQNFRKGLSFVPKLVDATSGSDFDGVTFAFVCVDKGAARAAIFDLLLEKKIPFIDVGMGLDRKHGPLNGMLRTTYFSVEEGQKVRGKGLAPLSDAANDEYKRNIQISELNALNAALAMLKFKQLRGFYLQEAAPPFHLLFEISDLRTTGETQLE